MATETKSVALPRDLRLACPEGLIPTMDSCMIEIDAGDGDKLPAYWSRPNIAGRTGIVLAMSVWGLNRDLRAWADLLAGLGYAVVAPNLFWKGDRDHAIDYDMSRFERIIQLMGSIDDDDAVAILARAAARLRDAGIERIGVVGWCLGGRLAAIAATGDVFDAAVAFYPTRLETRLEVVERLTAPLSVHLPEIEEFGTTEDSIDVIVHRLSSAGSGVEAFVYEGAHHGFGFDDPHPHHHRAAARLAEARAITFLHDRLGIGGTDG